MKEYILVIPARYESTRFPGKPLIDILGLSMINRVYLQCKKAVPKELIYIATDSEKIKSHVSSFTKNIIMTSSECKTGTDRVAEVAKLIDAKYYINVQGDEPIMNPDDIKKIIEEISHKNQNIIAGYCEINDEESYFSESIPKVVFSKNKNLLYISRGPIPFNKKRKFNFAYRQVCVYAFPKLALEQFSYVSEKTSLENEEDLELLRFLEMGVEVRMIKLSNHSIAVDMKEDLQKVINKIKDES